MLQMQGKMESESESESELMLARKQLMMLMGVLTIRRMGMRMGTTMMMLTGMVVRRLQPSPLQQNLR